VFKVAACCIRPPKTKLSIVKLPKYRLTDSQKHLSADKIPSEHVCQWAQKGEIIKSSDRRLILIDAPFKREMQSEWKFGEKRRKRSEAGILRGVRDLLLSVQVLWTDWRYGRRVTVCSKFY
jgi:hypothetical protein